MEYRVIFCGDRYWKDADLIEEEMKRFPKDTTTIIEGEANGTDMLSRMVADKLGYKVIKVRADWKRYSLGVGPIRNVRMLDEFRANRVVAFHDDIKNSKGTAHCVREARKRRIPVRIVTHEGCGLDKFF